MDQVKVALAVVKKYHFWILSLVVLLTGATVWFMAADTLAKAFEADKSKIETATKSLDPFSGGELPNASFKEKVDKLHDGLKQEVGEVWKELYQQQVRQFVWPKLIAADIAKLQPGEPIPERLRAFYNNNIVRDEWQRVLDEIDIRRPKESEEGGAGRNGMPMGGFGANSTADLEGLVVWDAARRQAIIDRYYTEKPPSDLRVRLTQEDLWLFEHSLIPVVQRVNANAHDAADATIKRIDVLDLAQWAINAANEREFVLYKPGDGKSNQGGGMGTGMAGGMDMGAMGGGMMEGGGGMGEGMMAAGGGMNAGGAEGGGGAAAAAGGGDAAGGADENAGDSALLDNRYLDDQGKPMKGDPSGYAEFKQMFVYMKFIMNQRKVPDLLASCANVPLPIEVRQVRVHVIEQATGASQQGGMMGMGGGMMGMGGGMGGMGGMGGGGESIPYEPGPYDAIVELSGVIYLYNPPDIAKLGSKAPAERSFSVPKGRVALPGSGNRSGMNMGMGNFNPGAPGAPGQ